jgi:ribose transport system ATP-binding protein
MLEVRNISKAFPGVRALDDVSLTFRAGEIHALVGENGAGKSTLIKIVTGLYRPDSGAILLDGNPRRFESCRDSQLAGIGIVPQEAQIVPDASVAENIMLDQFDRFAGRAGRLDWRRIHAEAKRWMDRVGLGVAPDALARDLSAARKQLIQIARALALDVKILLLDEPTSSLTEHESERLFEILRDLRKRGVALVFVSHRLEDVFKISDRVSVLRDGRLAGAGEIGRMQVQDLVRMMIGRTSSDEHVGRLNPDWNDAVLEARDVCREGKVRRMSFKLHRNEILGFYGLVGSGRTELAKILIGEDRKDSGAVLVRGREEEIRGAEEALCRHRIGYVTENRKEDGLFLDDSVLMNTALTVWDRIARLWPVRHIPADEEQAIAGRLAGRLQVKTPSLSTRIGSLSGGNQQKVCIAKWLAADCDILIIDEPTVGIDIGAKEQIHRLIYELAAKSGKSIIVISSDMPEIARLAGRILVFREGEIVGEVRDIDAAPKNYAQVSQEIGAFLV